MGRRSLTLSIALAALSGPVVAVALADAVPGATYNGSAAAWDGSVVNIRLAVSNDGTLVDSYQVDGHGKNASGGVCSMSFGESDANGAWPGAPITNGSFSNTQTGGTITGTFDGPQSAHGTFRYQSTGCDTGTLHWSATTTSPPPTSTSTTGTGGTTGTGTTTTPSGGHGHKPSAATRITLRRAGSKLVGAVVSPQASCQPGRTVILWRGKRRVRTVHLAHAGKFSFRVTPSLVGKQVRASALAKSMPSVTCAAGSSPFIKA